MNDKYFKKQKKVFTSSSISRDTSDFLKQFTNRFEPLACNDFCQNASSD